MNLLILKVMTFRDYGGSRGLNNNAISPKLKNRVRRLTPSTRGAHLRSTKLRFMGTVGTRGRRGLMSMSTFVSRGCNSCNVSRSCFSGLRTLCGRAHPSRSCCSTTQGDGPITTVHSLVTVDLATTRGNTRLIRDTRCVCASALGTNLGSLCNNFGPSTGCRA